MKAILSTLIGGTIVFLMLLFPLALMVHLFWPHIVDAMFSGFVDQGLLSREISYDQAIPLVGLILMFRILPAVSKMISKELVDG